MLFIVNGVLMSISFIMMRGTPGYRFSPKQYGMRVRMAVATFGSA